MGTAEVGQLAEPAVPGATLMAQETDSRLRAMDCETLAFRNIGPPPGRTGPTGIVGMEWEAALTREDLRQG